MTRLCVFLLFSLQFFLRNVWGIRGNDVPLHLTMRQLAAFLLFLLLLLSCTDGERMRQRLNDLQTANQADSLLTDDSLALALTDYFDRHGTPNEQMLAHYLLGRTYADMGEAPAALDVYFDALELADTTAEDCDYGVLRGIYGQMSQIFHRQNLPHDEIWAMGHYIDCIRHSGDTLEYLIAKRQMIRPYFLLNEKDSVLQIIHDSHQELERLGYHEEAARSIISSIYIYIERNQLDKARKSIDLLERQSGLFDSKGNISKGREHYYFTKGSYLMAVGQPDSAEQYFRKAISSGLYSSGYKGLLSVYRQKKNPDSILHFSNLYETALDSLHNQMRTDAIHQAASLYNYNRSMRLAEQEARKAQRARMWIGLVSGIAGVIIFIGYCIYARNQREKSRLARRLLDVQKERQCVKDELQKLKAKDFESLIVRKEKRVQELEQIITELQGATHADNLHEFESSHIVKVFIKKARFQSEHPVPSDAEWSLLQSQFSKDMSEMFHFFYSGKSLSSLELRTCILLMAGFQESDIVNLTQTSAPAVSTAKSRANQKLFGQSGATTLKYNLFQKKKRL